MDDPCSAAALDARIRRYFEEHPNAADTVEGVRRWWLSDLACSSAAVEDALERLVAEGLLGARLLGDGSIVYSRHIERDGEP